MMKNTNCKVFLLCENVATTTIPHPILKRVDACARCAKKMVDLKNGKRFINQLINQLEHL